MKPIEKEELKFKTMKKELVNAYAFNIGYLYFECIVNNHEGEIDKLEFAKGELAGRLANMNITIPQPLDYYISTDFKIIKQFMMKVGGTFRGQMPGSEQYLAYAFDNLFNISTQKNKFTGKIDFPKGLEPEILNLDYMNALNVYFYNVIASQY